MTRFTSFISAGSFCMAGALLSSIASVAIADQHASKIPSHARTQLSWSFPSSDENWDGGLGVQGQLLFPATIFGLPDAYRLGVSVGMSTWDANEDTQTITGGNAVSGALSGDMQFTQLGFSILRDQPLDEAWLTFETGLLYQNISSDTDITFNYASNATQTQDLDIDDSFAALIAVDLNFKVATSANAFVGLAYQLDLSKGDASAFNDANENVTSALILRSGVEFAF
jgi:hypothetical protein